MSLFVIVPIGSVYVGTEWFAVTCRNFCSHMPIPAQAPAELLSLPQSIQPPAHNSVKKPPWPQGTWLSDHLLSKCLSSRPLFPPKLLLSLKKDPEHQITVSRFVPSANLELLSHFLTQEAGVEGVQHHSHFSQHI